MSEWHSVDKVVLVISVCIGRFVTYLLTYSMVQSPS